MATLTGRTISASYTELLKTTNSAGLTSSLDVVEDGDATQSAFQISTAGIKSTGTLEVTGLSTLQSLALASGVTATGIIDDDTMATAAATNLATAESIKAYADTKQDAVTAGDGLSFTGATLNAEVTQAELDAKQDTVTAGDGLSFDGATLNAEVTQAELDAIDSNATHTGEVTGATALTIADNVVDEANLKIDNAPTNNYVLTAKSSAAGGLTWAAAPGAGGGEANTGSNLGTGGKDVFKEMSGAVLQFRQLKAGTNVTLTENADDITIDASGGGGSGDMTGVDITAGDGLEISQSNTTSGDYTATVSADLKANGGLVIESGEMAIDLAASTITGTLADGNIASAATWNAKAAGDHNHSGVYEPADADIAKTDVSSTWTTAQIPSTRTAAFEQPDFDTYQNFVFTLTDGTTHTLTNPTTDSGNAGQTGVIVLIQPSSGTAATLAITASGDYKPVGGTAPTLSSTLGAVDILPYMIQADNTVLLGAPQLDFKATS